jgi:Fe-S oxidoreductase
MQEKKPENPILMKNTAGNGPKSSCREIAAGCVECGICVKKCAFLKKYGTPKQIADSWLREEESSAVNPFACSLCSLCTAVCPVDIDPRQMFLAMRCHAAARDASVLKPHKLLLNFERRGTSKRYSFYGLPPGCDTVLFPGCSLAGSRPRRVMQLFDYLTNSIPNLGIVLNCCTKPSHDLGRTSFFQAMFGEMQQYLGSHGVKNIIAACPSCHSVFSQYGGSFNFIHVYDLLQEQDFQPEAGLPPATVTVQDSCVARLDTNMQQRVRHLIQARGVALEEMRHHGSKTFCCGEGGGAHFVAPDLAGSWAKTRRQEAQNRRIITFCSGCAHFLGKVTPTTHLLDLLFDPAAALAGKIRVGRSPFTYLKRILLKRQFRKKMRYGFSRERVFSQEK